MVRWACPLKCYRLIITTFQLTSICFFKLDGDFLKAISLWCLGAQSLQRIRKELFLYPTILKNSSRYGQRCIRVGWSSCDWLGYFAPVLFLSLCYGHLRTWLHTSAMSSVGVTSYKVGIAYLSQHCQSRCQTQTLIYSNISLPNNLL